MITFQKRKTVALKTLEGVSVVVRPLSVEERLAFAVERSAQDDRLAEINREIAGLYAESKDMMPADISTASPAEVAAANAALAKAGIARKVQRLEIDGQVIQRAIDIDMIKLSAESVSGVVIDGEPADIADFIAMAPADAIAELVAAIRGASFLSADEEKN